MIDFDKLGADIKKSWNKDPEIKARAKKINVLMRGGMSHKKALVASEAKSKAVAKKKEMPTSEKIKRGLPYSIKTPKGVDRRDYNPGKGTY